MHRVRYGFKKRTPPRTCECSHDYLEHTPPGNMCFHCGCEKFSSVGKNKYRNEKADYQGGLYHSKLERDYAFELDMRQRAGEIKEIQRQVKISLDVNGVHITNYFIDFVVTYADGVEEFIEVKGFVTRDWQLKWRLFEALYKDRANTRLLIVK